jgi:hypothetical protein
MRHDTQELEIFLSLDFDAEGYRLVKAVIDANDPIEGMVTWIEMGRIPYVIGQVNAVNRLSGYYDLETSTYWLPYTGVINADGIRTMSTGTLSGSGINTNANFVPGVKLRASGGMFNSGEYDADSFVDSYIARAIVADAWGHPTVNQLDIVKTSFGLHQGRFRESAASSRYYCDYGVVFSAMNLPKPVHRDADDVLRLIYTYQLGNS